MLTRVFYALMPLDHKRPGGVWWYRDLTFRESREFIDAIKNVATAIRVTHQFIPQDPMNINPPADAAVIK